MAEETEMIDVQGARVHNLKNIDVSIPRNSLAVITGLSGSGKSSLAFDTIFAEGQRRYIETFSAYARNFLGGMERPDVDKITGLSPVISIDQKTTNKNPRSTVGTTTEIYDYLRLLSSDQSFGTAIGIAGALSSLGTMTASSLFGFAGDAFGLSKAYIGLGIICMGAAVIYTLLDISITYRNRNMNQIVAGSCTSAEKI